jgi:hypothetical protein
MHLSHRDMLRSVAPVGPTSLVLGIVKRAAYDPDHGHSIARLRLSESVIFVTASRLESREPMFGHRVFCLLSVYLFK